MPGTTAGSRVVWAIWTLTALACVPLLYVAAPYLVPVVAAAVLALILGPVHGALVKRSVASALVALGLVLALILTITGLSIALAGSFASWVNDLPRFGLALESLSGELRSVFGILQDAGHAVEDATGVDPSQGSGRLADMVASFAGSLAMQTPILVGQFVLFFALLFFLLEGRMRLRDGLLRLCMTRRARLRAARIVRDAETRVSRYLLTITLINAALGAVTTMVMMAIGLPNPVLWGVLAFAVNFAPYLGPAVLGALLLGAGLINFDSLGLALAPALAFMALNTVEAYFITPSILGTSLRLEPAILLIALVLLFGLWGIAGAVLAMPLVLIAQAILNHMFPA